MIGCYSRSILRKFDLEEHVRAAVPFFISLVLVAFSHGRISVVVDLIRS